MSLRRWLFYWSALWFTADHSIARLTSEDSHVDKAGSPAATPTVVNGFAEESNAAESKTPDKDIVVCGNGKDSEGVTKNRPPQWEVLTKEHFSFNTKVKLGDFLEQKPGEKVYYYPVSSACVEVLV